MSEDKDADYPGQGGMGEAYAKIQKQRQEEVANIFPSWNIRNLVQQIAGMDSDIAPLKRQIEEIEKERTKVIERLRRIMDV